MGFRGMAPEYNWVYWHASLADAVIEQVNWDMSKVRDKLRRDIDAHIASIRAAKLSEIITLYEV